LVHDRVVLKISLTDSSNLDATGHNLSSHSLSSILVQLSLIVVDLARVDLAEEGHQFGVEHGRKEFRMEGWVTETFLEPVALVIGPFRMNLCHTNFLLGRRKVPEVGYERVVDIDLEDDDQEDRGKGGDPDKSSETFLKTNG
jgi:hypothetical protein